MEQTPEELVNELRRIAASEKPSAETTNEPGPIGIRVEDQKVSQAENNKEEEMAEFMRLKNLLQEGKGDDNDRTRALLLAHKLGIKPSR